MTDMHDALKQEAARRQPSAYPSFGDVLRGHRTRRRQALAVVSAAVVAFATMTVFAVTAADNGSQSSPLPAHSITVLTPVSGVVTAVGGPYGATPDVAPGIVRIVSADGAFRHQWHTDDRGQWQASLPPGTYTISATSPSYDANQLTCHTEDAQINVGALPVSGVAVLCERA